MQILVVKDLTEASVGTAVEESLANHFAVRSYPLTPNSGNFPVFEIFPSSYSGMTKV